MSATGPELAARVEAARVKAGAMTDCNAMLAFHCFCGSLGVLVGNEDPNLLPFTPERVTDALETAVASREGHA